MINYLFNKWKFRHKKVKKEWLQPSVIEYVLMHKKRGITKKSVIYELMQSHQITYDEAYALYSYILKYVRIEQHIKKKPE